MEFFLQTLVKRKFISQDTMLGLNQFLMIIASITAVRMMIFSHLHFGLSLFSLFLNFVNRGHENANALCVLGLGYIW